MTTTGNGGPAQPPPGQPTQPQLNVLGQYIKDFSFENPNAPRSLTPSQTQPAIQIQINVGVQHTTPLAIGPFCKRAEANELTRVVRAWRGVNNGHSWKFPVALEG